MKFFTKNHSRTPYDAKRLLNFLAIFSKFNDNPKKSLQEINMFLNITVYFLKNNAHLQENSDLWSLVSYSHHFIVSLLMQAAE